jgi:hypothetical protein
MVHLEITGIPQLQQALQRLTPVVETAMREGLMLEAEAILATSQSLVPVLTGLLRSSGMVEPHAQGADIRYGGHGLAPYAAKIELDATLNHPHGGQSHFLSQPFYTASADVADHLAQAVWVALSREGRAR